MNEERPGEQMSVPGDLSPANLLLRGELRPGDAGVADSRSEAAPRIWTPFAVTAISLVAFLLISFLAMLLAILVVKGVPTINTIRDPVLLAEVAQSRVGFLIMVVTPQLALLLPAIGAAVLSPFPTLERLGLRRGGWPLWAWAAAMFAAPMVGLISGAISQQVLEPSDHLEQMSGLFQAQGQDGFLIPLAFLIGLTPAFCEELLFRGYVQTRLTQSLAPGIGILISSLLFAGFHLDFVHVITVFPIGVFLGWVAFRSDSLGPAMLGHFLNNVIGVTVMVSVQGTEPEDVPGPILGFLSVVLLGGMLGIVGTLAAAIRYPRAMSKDGIARVDATELSPEDFG